MVTDRTLNAIINEILEITPDIQCEPKLDDLGAVLIQSIQGFLWDDYHILSEEQLNRVVKCIESQIKDAIDEDLSPNADFLVANTIQTQAWAAKALENLGFKPVGPFVRPREEYQNKLTTWVLNCKEWRNRQ